MAEIGYTDYVYDDGTYEDDSLHAQPQTAQKPASTSKIVSILGAAASVALVAGVGVWSYQLMVRDVSGVPVVRAAEGPCGSSRKTPADVRQITRGWP